MRRVKVGVLAGTLAATLALGISSSASADHSVLERVSVGANGTGNSSSATAAASFAGSSTDGKHVFFDTKEALVPADTDTSTDVYERSGATTTLVSAGAINGNGAFDALYAGASDDGSRVWFHTKEALVAGDTDSSHYDVYERAGGVTTLVSTGPSSTNAQVDAFFRGASTTGAKVFFETPEALTATDTKARTDVYQRSASTTTLVSTGSTSATGNFFARFRGASTDGAHVFFESDDRLTATDTDLETDVYDRDTVANTTTLVSIGPNGGNAAVPAFFDASSDTGSLVFFHTAERLDTTADTDGFTDVYQRTGGVTTIISTSASAGNGARHADFAGSSTTGSVVYFETDESMLAADTDTSFDVYKRTGGVTTLASDGTAATDPNVDATALGVSDDGSHVYFDTTEHITAADTDAKFDIYDRNTVASTTTLVSVGSPGGNGAFDAFFDGSSGDASRVFFDTAESLVAADTDSSFDVYERQGATLTLISKGPNAGNSAFHVTFVGATPDGTSVFMHSNEKLAFDDTDTVQDVYRAGLFGGGYPRPKGASPFRASLVPAYTPCTTGNTTHGGNPPLNAASCKPPVTITNDVTMGTPDANGAGAGFSGNVLLKTTATPDVTITGVFNDVRCGPGTTAPAKCATANAVSGADYTGELRAALSLRMTDLWNSTAPGGGPDAATVQDNGLNATFPCASTTDTTVGSTCTLSTSANALVGGLVIDSKRATWQIDQISVIDGGPDGLISTASGNKVFLKQGVFAP
jgi:hypothetical protein